MWAGRWWLVSEVEVRRALVERQMSTTGLRKHTLRLSFDIAHRLAATSHILVSSSDTPCSLESCVLQPLCGIRDMSADNEGHACN